jgi:glycosyltransferase involved in cell wall biosynthesis
MQKVSTPDQPSMTVPVVLDVRVVTGTGGGPDKTILNAPRFLEPMGYRNLCAYMHPPADPGFDTLRERARCLDTPLISIDDRGPWDWRVATELLALCRRERVAIWHGHDYKSNLLGLLLRPFWPMRLVSTVHGWGVMGERRTQLYNRVDRLCLPFYERVVCVSEDLHHACRTLGVPEHRCLLIENAIDTTQFTRRTGRDEAKRRLGLPAAGFTVGAVGRLSEEKAYDLLIRAVDRLIGDGHDVALLIVGEGNQRAKLEALRTELGRGDRIRLLGFQSDVIPLYEAMDLFVLSSLREGLPNVVLEAMALEVPVVATRIAGIPRLIEDCRNGLLVEPGSIDALAEAITRTINDPGLRLLLQWEGRTTVESHHSFAVRMDRFRALYDELLERQPEPVSPRKVASA